MIIWSTAQPQADAKHLLKQTLDELSHHGPQESRSDSAPGSVVGLVGFSILLDDPGFQVMRGV